MEISQTTWMDSQQIMVNFMLQLWQALSHVVQLLSIILRI